MVLIGVSACAERVEPSVAIAPLSGPPGTTVQVTGEGFPAATDVLVGAGPEGADYFVTQPLYTDAEGQIATEIVIPETAQPGASWVVVVEETPQEGAVLARSQTFEVLPSPTAVAPNVTIAPLSGPPGTVVQVSAEGFPPGGDVLVGAGREDTEFAVVETVQADAAGTVTASVTIPDAAEPGMPWVVVVQEEGPGGLEAKSETFEVTVPEVTPTAVEPSAAIAPLSGAPGTEIQVTAAGFPPQTEVQVGAGRQGSEFGVTQTEMTDAQGELVTTLTLPDFAEPGDPWVVVVRVVERGGAKATSPVFQVTGESGTDAPRVEIAPLSGPPGTPIEVEAPGFPPETEVQVGAGRQGSEFGVTQTEMTDAQGELVTTLTLPDFAEPGDPWVVVVRVVERGGAQATSPVFQVTAPEPGPTPTEADGALFDRVNIYLIALEDAGERGKEIGCGDSVVPVEVPVEPTVAPLTAALKELLAVEERLYGQSGLYNALFRSDLQVESVAVEDGEAVIRLTGTLNLGGACDAPRIRAQLEETALQYSTVNTVSIYINGTSLEALLQQ
jgi:hypothetical protein